jgi:O-methyltransferase
MKNAIIRFINSLGYDINKRYKSISQDYRYTDFEKEFLPIYSETKDYSMTSPERLYALYKAVEYIVKNNIQGSFVECGVWRGGSAMVIIKTLQLFNITDRKIYLYDTYEGMVEPKDRDTGPQNVKASEFYKDKDKKNNHWWCYAGLDEVKDNMSKTGYPMKNFEFVQGKVEDTIPDNVPDKIALLRLDTDWYDSTYHEMKYLYPKVEKDGVLVLDDYGYWKGSKDAVDQYFGEIKSSPLLNRIDTGGRLVIKR